MTKNQHFYQYQLNRPLGRGWLGEVHAATDLDENHEVALRIVGEKTSQQSFLIIQLERLLLKINSLQHPNILPTEILQQRDSFSFYTMRLASQGSLRQLIQRQERASQTIALVIAVELIRQAVSGLAYAHSQGLMHGDLKPENILLIPGRSLLGQEGYTVQLTDFGLAELRVGSHGIHDSTVINTLAYSSPEQLRGIRNEIRTDIYVIGLILYELVTGMVPFDIHDSAEAFEKHQHVAPQQPSLIRKDIPEALEEIILTCLAKNPDDRYATAQELEDALQSVLNTFMPSGPEPTLRLPPLPFVPATPTLDFPNAGIVPRLLVFNEHGEKIRDIPLNQNVITIGRAPNNTVILEHGGVSRHHLTLEFTSGTAYVTELTATNSTTMDGVPLSPMTPLRWPYRTTIYLRPYWLVLIGPEEKTTRPRIVVKPEVDQLLLIPGKPQQLLITLANTGQTVDHFQLSLDGIPPEWIQNPYTEVQLNPGTQTTTSLTLMAPRDSRSRAGEYPSTLLARSREDRNQYGRSPIIIQVDAFREVKATITPPIRRTWRHTYFYFELENRSNFDGLYTVILRDTEGQIRLIPRPQDLVHLDQMVGQQNIGSGLTTPRLIDPNQLAREAIRQAQSEALMIGGHVVRQVLRGEGRIWLEDLSTIKPLKAGEVSEERIQVRVPLRWIGLSSQHRFTIDTFDLIERAERPNSSPVANSSAELYHTPLIPLWLLPLLLLLVGIFIWWLMRPPLINQFTLDGKSTIVRPNQPFSLRWDTQNAYNIKILELGSQGQNLHTSGTIKVPGINKDNKYTLEARNLIGTLRTSTVTISPQFAKPIIQKFIVSPARVRGNQPVTVKWQVANSNQVNISALGQVPPNGSRTFIPNKDMTLQIVARNGTESDTASAGITVAGAKINIFKVTPNYILRGNSATLTWDVSDATNVNIDTLGTVPAKGSQTVSPHDSTTYTLTAQGGNNSTSTATTRLQVNIPTPKITELSVSPNPVKSNQKVTIRWVTQNATNITLQDGTGGAQTVSPFGTLTIDAPPANSDVVLTASNDAHDQDSKSQSLRVIPIDEAAVAAAAKAQQQANQERQLDEQEKQNLGRITFTAEPKQIQGQGDVTLTWNAPGFQNVYILPLKGPKKGVFDSAGVQTVKNINSTRIYTLRVFLRKGGKIDISRVVKVIPLPVNIRIFQATPNMLLQPGQTTLQWDIANASSGIQLKGLYGPLPHGLWPSKGTTTVSLSKTRTFNLIAGGREANLTVTVKPPPPEITEFSVTPTDITKPTTITLRWNVNHAGTVQINNLPGPLRHHLWPSHGVATIRIKKTMKFDLIVGNTIRSQIVNFHPTTISKTPINNTTPATPIPNNIPATPTTNPSPTPIVNPQIAYFYATPSTISPGGKVTLRWKVLNIDKVIIDGLNGTQAPIGSIDVYPRKILSYTLHAGGISKTLNINLKAPIISPYQDLLGLWNHPFGSFTIDTINGRRGKGTFKTGNLIGVPVEFVFSGNTITGTSEKGDDFKFVLALSEDHLTSIGTYTLRDKGERWCAYRPNVSPPEGCKVAP